MPKAVAKKKAKPNKPAKPVPPTKEQLAYQAHRVQVTKAVEVKSALPHGQKDTPAMREAFLSWLRLGATPTRAARECKLGRRTVFDWREKDPEFKLAWEEAVEAGIHRLEDEAVRRGVDGVDRPVFQGGECVGFVREYSDDLLKFMLAARDPARFSRNAFNGSPVGDFNFTFNFGNTQVNVAAAQAKPAETDVRTPVDGLVPDGRDIQSGPLLDHRSDDEGGEDGGVPSLVGGRGDAGEQG